MKCGAAEGWIRSTGVHSLIYLHSVDSYKVKLTLKIQNMS
jgi:hypothetical protein